MNQVYIHPCGYCEDSNKDNYLNFYLTFKKWNTNNWNQKNQDEKVEKKESTALSGYLFKLNCCHGKLLIPCWPITLMHSVRLYPLITYQDICQNVQSSVILVSFMINTEYSNSASDLITLILKQVHASCSQNVFCFFLFRHQTFSHTLSLICN